MACRVYGEVMNWGDWVIDRDQRVCRIGGHDGYQAGCVMLYDHKGEFAGYDNRRRLTPLDLQHFTTDDEKRFAAEVLNEMRDMYLAEVTI